MRQLIHKLQIYLDSSHGKRTPFWQLYNLIDRNPDRLIFVDNIDTTNETNAESKIIQLKRNMEMANKVVGSVHKFMTSEPIMLTEILRNAVIQNKKN